MKKSDANQKNDFDKMTSLGLVKLERAEKEFLEADGRLWAKINHLYDHYGISRGVPIRVVFEYGYAIAIERGEVDPPNPFAVNKKTGPSRA